MTVRMWEVRAASENAAAALVAWLLSTGLPAVAGEPGYDHGEVFTGAEHRVVVLTWWQDTSVEIPDPQTHLLARPAHAWDFQSAGVR